MQIMAYNAYIDLEKLNFNEQVALRKTLSKALAF